MDKETKQMFDLILQKLDSMDKRQESMEKRLESMEIGLESMEKRLGSVEKRLDEIFVVAKAIEHSNNLRKAEVDNLTYKVVQVEGTINDIGELIEKRKAIK